MYIRITGGLVKTHTGGGYPRVADSVVWGEVQQSAFPTSSQGMATMLVWEPYFGSENFKVSGDMKIMNPIRTSLTAHTHEE